MKAIKTSPASRRTVYLGSSRLPTISGWRSNKVHQGSPQIMPPMNADRTILISVHRVFLFFRIARSFGIPARSFASEPSRDRDEATHRKRTEPDSGALLVTRGF